MVLNNPIYSKDSPLQVLTLSSSFKKKIVKAVINNEITSFLSYQD